MRIVLAVLALACCSQAAAQQQHHHELEAARGARERHAVVDISAP